MDTPTINDILDCIDKALHSDYRSDGFAIQGYRESGNTLWFRTPDTASVFKITVQELPRDSWPAAPV